MGMRQPAPPAQQAPQGQAPQGQASSGAAEDAQESKTQSPQDLIAELGSGLKQFAQMLAQAPNVPPALKQQSMQLYQGFQQIIASVSGPKPAQNSGQTTPEQGGSSGAMPADMSGGRKVVPA